LFVRFSGGNAHKTAEVDVRKQTRHAVVTHFRHSIDWRMSLNLAISAFLTYLFDRSKHFTVAV